MIELIAAVDKITIDKEGQTKLNLIIPLDFLSSVRKLIETNGPGGKNFALAMSPLTDRDTNNHLDLIDEVEFLNPDDSV